MKRLVVCVGALAVVWLAVVLQARYEAADNYYRACREIRGTPVHNGAHWECLLPR